MSSTEVRTPELTAEELDLVAEFLRRELHNLPIEIRHTDKRTAKEELHRRLDMCEALLAKITSKAV